MATGRSFSPHTPIQSPPLNSPFIPSSPTMDQPPSGMITRERTLSYAYRSPSRSRRKICSTRPSSKTTSTQTPPPPRHLLWTRLQQPCRAKRRQRCHSSPTHHRTQMDRRIVRHAAETLPSDPTIHFNWNATLQQLYQHGSASPLPDHPIQMHWGDTRHTITHLPDASVDLVFLDAFSSTRNSECWSLQFFQQIKRIMRPHAQLFTYAAAGPIRAGLLQAGFSIGETTPVGRPRGGTQATHDALLLQPILENERNSPQSHDPWHSLSRSHLLWTHREIVRDREQRILEFKT